MDTVPRVKLEGVEYQSVNAMFGILVGTAMNIQNQGGTPVRVSVNTVKPQADTEAFRIAPADLSVLTEIKTGNSEVWVYGNSIVHAEES